MSGDLSDTLPPPPPRPPEGASPAYLRVFEELRQFVSPQLVRELLDEGLHTVGASPEHAIGYDFRAMLVDYLPPRLDTFLPADVREAVMEALEEVLVDVSCPRRVDPAGWAVVTPDPG